MADPPRRRRVRNSLAPGLAALALGLALPTGQARGQSDPWQAMERLREWALYNDAGWNAIGRGDYARAETHFRMAIKLVRDRDPGDRRLLARSYHDLARVYYLQKRYDDAEPLARWALAVREKSPKGVTEAARFETNYLLGLVQRERNAFADSEILLRRALELHERNVEPGDPGLAVTIEALAAVCVEQRKFAEAEPLYQRAMTIRGRAAPEGDRATVETVVKFATLLRKTGRETEADRMAAQAKAIEDDILTRAAKARQTEAGTGAGAGRPRAARATRRFETFE